MSSVWLKDGSTDGLYPCCRCLAGGHQADVFDEGMSKQLSSSRTKKSTLGEGPDHVSLGAVSREIKNCAWMQSVERKEVGKTSPLHALDVWLLFLESTILLVCLEPLKNMLTNCSQATLLPVWVCLCVLEVGNKEKGGGFYRRRAA